MPTIDHIYVDPSIETNASGSTPYGIYDADKSFVSESVNVCKFVARRLGHPIMQLEIIGTLMLQHSSLLFLIGCSNSVLV